MTHTLHRQGSVEDLKSDYVLLAQLALGINDKKPVQKFEGNLQQLRIKN